MFGLSAHFYMGFDTDRTQTVPPRRGGGLHDGLHDGGLGPAAAVEKTSLRQPATGIQGGGGGGEGHEGGGGGGTMAGEEPVQERTIVDWCGKFVQPPADGGELSLRSAAPSPPPGHTTTTTSTPPQVHLFLPSG